MHELLSDPHHGLPLSVAAWVARSALRSGVIVWSDPRHQLYPPALAQSGIALHRVLLLRPKNPAEEIWATVECLKCKAVNATIVAPENLSHIESRRLQLAAERGGGIGILLRPLKQKNSAYAAATRWQVLPIAGDEQTQRWKLQLVHGRASRNEIFVEVNRENAIVRESDYLHPSKKLADRSSPAAQTG